MPKPGYTLDDLPDANTAGRDIGIDPTFLLEPDNVKLGCALVHELAHVAGATTNPGDPNAGAAEAALKSCLCKDQYNPKALGMRIEIQTLGRSRVV